jgi:hypothetical protein
MERTQEVGPIDDGLDFDFATEARGSSAGQAADEQAALRPTSLEHQWEREIARFTDRKTTVIGGLRARREHLYAGATSFFTITNYDTVHGHLDLIGRWSPDLVVLDEAQRIKNWNTRTARSVKRIASPYAIVLTGTPLENRLEELVSIVEFVDRHRLGPTFKFLAEHRFAMRAGSHVSWKRWRRPRRRSRNP